MRPSLALSCALLAACASTPRSGVNDDDPDDHGVHVVIGPTEPPPSGVGGPPWATGSTDGAPCGDKAPAKCALGRLCASDADCASGVCQPRGAWMHHCVRALSCDGGRGADDSCEGGVDCCTTIAVSGGTFHRRDDSSGLVSTATVSRFALDKYEVTVGRMRAFFHATSGDPRAHAPAAGAGAHPLAAGTGWRASWNARLPSSWDEIHARLGSECAVGGDNAAWGAATWTSVAGDNEDKPINCIDWYTLFAFCVWDGGRLPTDAEWGWVAGGGLEERAFPWGNDAPAFATHAGIVATAFLVPGTTSGRYTAGPPERSATDGPLHVAAVGAKQERSPWGHADLAGNVLEMVLDAAAPIPANCNNCVASADYPDPAPGTGAAPVHWDPTADGSRLARGGSWQGEVEGHAMANAASRRSVPVWRTSSTLGGRCAHDRP